MINQCKQFVWKAVKRPESDTHSAEMERLGIGNIMRAAKLMNWARHGKVQRARRRILAGGLEPLYGDEPSPPDRGVMHDGYLLDESGSWPHLSDLLAACEMIIARNGMTRTGSINREWIRDIMNWPFLDGYPSILNFITSPDIARIAAAYLGLLPGLSTTVPPGIRLTESHTKEEDIGRQPYRTSQLFHLDIHAAPMVYVIVLLRDVTEKSGPFCFLPASASDKVVKALGYRKRGRPFRLTDEQVFGVVDKSELKVLTGKAGTVLFLDPSRCFHFGSRDAVVPRYQAMYALVPPVRSDFTEWYMPPRVYPERDDESPLRKLMLDVTSAGD